MLCQRAKVSRSGFYGRINRSIAPPCEDESTIIEIFLRSNGTKGIRRLKMDFERLRRRPINHKRVRRIKRDFGLITTVRKKNKFRAIFRAGEESNVAPNLVKRQFCTKGKDIFLTTDITELRFSWGQRAYMAAVKDLRTKEIIAYRLGRRPTIDLAIAGLPKALADVPPEVRKRIVVHSDQGFQYTSHQYRNALEELGVRLSMSRKGNCLDNAPIESFFGHFKDEAGHRKCKKFSELERCVRSYMRYYNYERPQWALEKKTPAEAGVGMSLVN